MARIPDRFDRLVRKARQCDDTARQADYILGGLVALATWYFLNSGEREKPELAEVDCEGEKALLVFTDVGRIAEIAGEDVAKARALALDRDGALKQCLKRRVALLVNPGDDAVLIPFEQLEAFHAQWKERGAQQAAGFWIPNMTTEEEDFWQERGL